MAWRAAEVMEMNP